MYSSETKQKITESPRRNGKLLPRIENYKTRFFRWGNPVFLIHQVYCKSHYYVLASLECIPKSWEIKLGIQFYSPLIYIQSKTKKTFFKGLTSPLDNFLCMSFNNKKIRMQIFWSAILRRVTVHGGIACLSWEGPCLVSYYFYYY